MPWDKWQRMSKVCERLQPGSILKAVFKSIEDQAATYFLSCKPGGIFVNDI